MVQINSMAQYLSRNNKLHTSRKDHFSIKYMEDLETLVGSVAMEICQCHIKVHYYCVRGNLFYCSLLLQDGSLAKKLNTSLAFFVHDAFSLMDRGFVFTLIKTYLKKVKQL